MPLRKADVTSTRKFEDGEAWLVLRVGGLTKGEADQLRDVTAAMRVDPSALAGNPEAAVEIANTVARANRALFEILAVDWSLGDVTSDAYASLDQESGEWVDSCVQEVLLERQKRAEGNARSSKRPSRPARSSPKARS